jgi:anaerobic magnesium-protoporphyrin IX monomethyl ester cyclase
MKILFLQPPLGAWAMWGTHKAINIGHAQLAGYLRQHNPGVRLEALDCRALDLTEAQMLEKVGSIKPDIVYLGDILHTTGGLAVVFIYNEAARKIKERYPQMTTVVGGIFYASAPEFTMKENPQLDFCIAGESEETLSELVRELSGLRPNLAGIRGLCRRENGRVILNDYRPLITDLDSLPMPAYDLFPMEKYVGHTYWKNYSETWNSRGCPAACTFCYEWGQFDPRGHEDLKNYRYRSAKKVVDEMEILYNQYGTRVIVMMDDTYNVSRRRMEETIEESLKRNLQMKWMPLGRAPYFIRDIDLFKDLKRAGCFMCLVGLEVADDDELRKIKKGITVDQVKETVAKLREAGIATVLTWMIGFEDDDEEKIKNRYAAIDEIDPDIIALQFLTPIPGSPIWDEVTRKGLLKIEDLNKKIKQWDFHQPILPTKHLTIPQLADFASWAFREFYSKAGRIMRAMHNRDYDPLVGVCVRDFMENVSNFQKETHGAQSYVGKE